MNFLNNIDFSMKLKPFSLFGNVSGEDSFFGCDNNKCFHLSIETISPDEVMGIEFMGTLVHSSGFSSNIRSTPISSNDSIFNFSSSIRFSFSKSNFSVITFTNNSSEDVTTIPSVSSNDRKFLTLPTEQSQRLDNVGRLRISSPRLTTHILLLIVKLLGS